MTIKSNVYKAASLNDLDKLSTNNHEILKGLREAIETTEPKISRNSARKRKSDDVVDTSIDESTRVPDFMRNDLIATPTILNSRDAFFDKNNSPISQLTGSPVESCIDKECVIKTANLSSTMTIVKHVKSAIDFHRVGVQRAFVENFKRNLYIMVQVLAVLAVWLMSFLPVFMDV